MDWKCLRYEAKGFRILTPSKPDGSYIWWDDREFPGHKGWSKTLSAAKAACSRRARKKLKWKETWWETTEDGLCGHVEWDASAQLYRWTVYLSHVPDDVGSKDLLHSKLTVNYRGGSRTFKAAEACVELVFGTLRELVPRFYDHW